MKYRVYAIPEVSKDVKPFYIPVNSVEEGAKIIAALSFFDLYLLDNKFRKDESASMYGLEEYNEESQSWCTWEYIGDDGDYFDDVDEYIREKSLEGTDIKRWIMRMIDMNKEDK